MGIRSFFARQCGPEAWMARCLSRRLALDTNQKQQLLLLRERLQLLRNEMRDGIAAQRNALGDLLQGDSIDRPTALRLAGVPFAMASDRLPALVDATAEFYEVLSPAQRGRLRELVAQRCRGHRCS